MYSPSPRSSRCVLQAGNIFSAYTIYGLSNLGCSFPCSNAVYYNLSELWLALDNILHILPSVVLLVSLGASRLWMQSCLSGFPHFAHNIFVINLVWILSWLVSGASAYFFTCVVSTTYCHVMPMAWAMFLVALPVCANTNTTALGSTIVQLAFCSSCLYCLVVAVGWRTRYLWFVVAIPAFNTGMLVYQHCPPFRRQQHQPEI